jgi:NitT/TauT family transport system substrate-binding protein
MTQAPMTFAPMTFAPMTFARLSRAARTLGALAAAGVLLASPAAAQQLDRIAFGTNWVAQGEHGGFYQALADGTYRKYGLDVSILPGGPNVNNRLLLPVGRIEMFMSANTLQSFDAVEHNVPTVAVAAIFQKEPQVFIAHPGQGIEKFEDLKKLSLFVSKEGIPTYFQWLKADYGFDEAKVKPYTFNPQPFLADKRSAMQGYVTSEPYAIEKMAGFKPKVFLLADQGFNAYSTLIETRRDLIEKRPDMVQRFVDASIVGWYHYLYGDNTAGNTMIKQHNREMTDDVLAYSVAKMKEYGIVDSGDAATLGIGAMTDARMTSFFEKMVRAGVVNPTIDRTKAYTLQFVNKKVGIDLRPKP